MNPDVLRRYRELRRDGVRACQAILSAHYQPVSRFPGLTLDDAPWDRWTTLGSTGGFDITARVDYDTDPLTFGQFTSTWEPGAFPHPDWRANQPGYVSVHRWYISVAGTLEERQAAYTQAGYSRHEAWLTANATMLADLRADAQPNAVRVRVRASRAGIELSTAEVGSVNLGDVLKANDEHILMTIDELIDEALADANDAVGRLTPNPIDPALAEAIGQYAAASAAAHGSTEPATPAEVTAVILTALRAAHEHSTDDEVEAWRAVAAYALDRWPEIVFTDLETQVNAEEDEA